MASIGDLMTNGHGPQAWQARMLSLAMPLRRKLRLAREKTRLARADVSILGHPKCGSTWLRFQLARLYQRKFDLPTELIPRLEAYPKANRTVPYINMAGYEYIKLLVRRPAPNDELAAGRIVVQARHPCDIAVSLYFHILKHARLERKLLNGWPLDLDRRSISEFALDDPFGVRNVVDFYNNCARQMRALPRHLLVRYEDMRADPERELRRIVDFAGHVFDDADISDATVFASFENLKKIEIGNTFNTTRLRQGSSTDPDSSKVRRGKVGGYRDYFDKPVVEGLERIVANELDPVFGYGSRSASPGNSGPR
jgi:hypothetical protein